MSIRFLIDTDVMIDLLTDGLAIVEFLGEHLRPGPIGISLLTYGEILDGVLWGRNPQGDRSRLETELVASRIEIAPVTHGTIEHFAYIRGHLRKRGSSIGYGDTLIAATALEHGSTLVTRNTRHFNRVPGLHVITPVTP